MKIIISTNSINYCNNYYIAELLSNDNHKFVIDYNNKDQYKEVSKIELLSIN